MDIWKAAYLANHVVTFKAIT